MKVGKMVIPGGMIYVGKKLAGAESDYDVDAALIDPSLKVKHGEHGSGEEMPYWPSYSRVSPSVRGNYLKWLAEGRSNPAIDIGVVFLYFYGLERRVLVDPDIVSVSVAEKCEVHKEVLRLLSIYGDNRSFGNYAGSFASYLGVLIRENPVYKDEPPTEGRSWELPQSIRVAVAELSRDGLPVSLDWAYAWAWFDPQNNLRTPAKRCQEELRALFEIRYRQKYGDGIKIKPNKRRVKLEYRPASPSINGVPVQTLSDLPDVTSLTGPIRKLLALFDECTNDLDAYSRWLGRHPESHGSLQALALLPPELVAPEAIGGDAQELNEVLSSAVGAGSTASISSADILSHWPPSNPGKYRKSDAVALAQFLEKLGYGVKPDVRFNGARLDTVDHAVVFRLGKDAPSAPAGDYLTAALSLRLAAAVAVADGVVTDEEYRSLEQQVEESPTLRPGDRDRLRAHFEWLIVERPSLTGMKRKLGELKPSTRELLGQMLLAVAAADGSIDPEEIKTIRKLYGQLGLDPETIYSDLHSLAVEDSGPATDPVTVRPEERTPGYAIASLDEARGGKQPAARIVLDLRLVAAKRREAEQATALLSSVFCEEESDRDEAQHVGCVFHRKRPPNPIDAGHPIQGKAATHSDACRPPAGAQRRG